MSKLLVVWKSDNDVDINNFIMPFATNSKKQGWFDDVEVLIWGASAHKIKEDSDAQTIVSTLLASGIRLVACKYCADQVGVSELLTELGVTVMYTGVYLSTALQDSETEVLTI